MNFRDLIYNETKYIIIDISRDEFINGIDKIHPNISNEEKILLLEIAD